MRRHLVLAALLATLAASSHSYSALCGNVGGLDAAKRAAAPPPPGTNAQTAAVGKPTTSAAPASDGGLGQSEDGSGALDDSGSGVRKHGLRWQSFLPGVIK